MKIVHKHDKLSSFKVNNSTNIKMYHSYISKITLTILILERNTLHHVYVSFVPNLVMYTDLEYLKY